MKDLSVIILSYNTTQLTKNCLETLIASLQSSSLQSEIIVVDNASVDDSVKMLREYKKKEMPSNITFILLENTDNVGYPKGNNQGIRLAGGKYILLLNSDVEIKNVDFGNIISYMQDHDKIGGLTVEVNLPSGNIDPASHRGFPTIWSSFCYFAKLEKLTAAIPLLNKIFGGYHLTNLNLTTTHEIDSPTGAFYLIKANVLKEIKGLDEAFFMYGEDLDLSFRIKEAGYQIIYYPRYQVIHHKHQSGLKGQNDEVKKRTRHNFYEAMRIFYQKHYARKHSIVMNKIVYLGIDFLKGR